MNIKKTILSLALIFVASLNVAAQSQTEQGKDLDSLYAQNLLKTGTVAPEFSLPMPNRKIFSLTDHKGKYILLDFWASWCPDCRKDSPYIMSLYEKFAPKGVEFVGVSFDTKAEAWKNGVKKLGIKYTQVSDMKHMRESAVAQTYCVKWIPTVYVVDPEGKVVLGTVMSDKVGAYLTSVYPDCAE